ncbi:PREDICTED: regulator of G-protein signaling 17 [Habropoda laboriosa]|nr:PREDICTED: regulator of G-protein signaling 17 [Habropoda laboriosa]
MIEMSSGIGATAMGIGVSHGTGGGEGVAGGCRLRAQSQGQASGSSSNTQQSSQQQQQQQQQLQQQQQQPPSSQQAQQQQQRQPSGIMGRSKKDNCCLCWCCCCSCSNKCLAAVGGNSAGAGGAGEQGKKKGNAGVGSEHSSIVGDELSVAGNGFDGLDGLDVECSLDEIRSWGSSFDKLIRSPAGRYFFRQFLLSEYSDENIAFWMACEQLKRETNPEEIEKMARYIYERYISISSKKEVSLDSQVREIVNRNMVKPTPHTFDEAQLQIYTLMHRDSYPRFVNSEIYRRVASLGCGIQPGNNQEHTAVKPKGKKGTT